MGEPPRKAATYEDVLRAPDHLVAEVLAGELILSPRPAIPHGHSSSVAGADILGPFSRQPGGPGGPGGWWILDEPELHLGGDILVPDLAGWGRERMPVLPRAAFLDVAPDWACEFLSPQTHRLDRIRKMSVYARESIGHVWLVDADHHTLEVYRLVGGLLALAAAFEGDTIIRAEPFDAIELDMGRWWLPEDEPALPR